MHLTDLQIDRFGVWSDLTLPLNEHGLNVIYGPNEAGKSTLLRFVREILYGNRRTAPTNSRRVYASLQNEPAVGSLNAVHEGQRFSIRRVRSPEGGTRLQLVGPYETPLAGSELSRLLGETSAEVFDRVFAVDLYELQELATLDHAEVAGHLYGASVGPEGQRLLRRVDNMLHRRDVLWTGSNPGGRLANLLNQRRALVERLGQMDDRPRLYADLRRRRDELDIEIRDFRERRSNLQNELAGRRQLARLWPVWNQLEGYKSTLAKLPAGPALPADGIAQLDSLDAEQTQAQLRRDKLRQQIAEKERKLEALGPEPELMRYEPALRAMIQMRPWITEQQSTQRQLKQSEQVLVDAARQSRLAIGGNWSESRLRDVSCDSEMQFRLSAAAEKFRKANARRADLRRTYQRLQQRSANQETALQDRLLGQVGRSSGEAAAATRRRIAALEQILKLSAKEEALDRRGADFRQRLTLLGEQLDVPPWVTLVLALFAIGGAIFAVLGLITGVMTSALVGAIYLMLGLTCGSLAVRLRAHFDSAIQETADSLRHHQRAEEIELRKVREELSRLTETTHRPQPSHGAKPARNTIEIDPGVLFQAEIQQLAEDEELARQQRRFANRRKLMTRFRVRLRKAQQRVDSARQEWCQTLMALHLDETLDFEAATGQWQRLQAGLAALNTVETARKERATAEASLRVIGEPIASMAKALGMPAPSSDPLAILASWEKELNVEANRATERKRTHGELELLQNQFGEIEGRLREYSRQKTTLLAAAGVRSREEFERRLETAVERQELEELIDLTTTELQELVEEEPEIAITEEDLDAFDPAGNIQYLNLAAQRQEELEARLERACEQRGKIAQQLGDLETDREGETLQERRSRLDALIRETFEKALAATIAAQAAEHARDVFERTESTPALQAAGKFLSRLTQGRYTRVWTPLGERSLRIEEQSGSVLQVEQLSGGTREQLFLALRLGLIEQMAERGIRLPVVLDDVFVNFDQARTEAALETLQDFCRQGRQVLFFTCHQHLARLAESRGVAPLWLPANDGHRGQRLAG